MHLEESVEQDNWSIWTTFLCRRALFMDVPGEKDGFIYVHLPNMVARQMGFSQSIQPPYSCDP